MRKWGLFFILSTVLLGTCACSRDLVPDSVLEGLHKPVITGISPAVARSSGAGFFLNVATEYQEDDSYVLYIDDRRIGQDVPGYWRTALGWMLSKELVSEMLGSQESASLNVRVTSIPQAYDISDHFSEYAEYVSDPVKLEISQGETKFSVPRRLFPEWAHSQEPLLRCDARGHVYLAWLELLNGVYQAFFSFSADGGETWSQVLNISRSGESVSELDLAVDGAGHFYLAWMVYRSEGSSAYFCRSLDNGATWHLPQRLNGENEAGANPALDVDERGFVSVAWRVEEGQETNALRLSRSVDLGASWETRVLAVPEGYSWGDPVLGSREDGLRFLAYGGQFGGEHGFYFFSSSDAGANWRAQQFRTGDYRSPFEKFSAARLNSQSQVFFSWGASSTTGHSSFYGNYLMRREASGTWSTVQALHDICSTVNEKTALSVRPDGVDVVLTQKGGLFLLRSPDDARNWSAPEFIPGADGLLIATSPDTVRLPSGKTLMAFIKKETPMDGGLYLAGFD